MNKKLFGFIAILVIVAALPLTLIVLRQRQETRQRATGGQVSLYFTKGTSTTPITQLALAPDEQVQLNLYLNAGSDNINGVDFTINFDQGLTLNTVSEGSGANRFSIPLLSLPDNQNRTLRFAKVTNSTSTISTNPINGILHLASLTFTAADTPSSGNITFADKVITSPARNVPLTIPPLTLPYTIALPPTATPTLTPTATPTLTPTPTATPSATPTPAGPTIQLSLALSGIGHGTNRNGNPKTPARPISLFLYDGNDRLVNANTPITGQIIYQNGDGLFHGSASIPLSIQEGSYIMKVKTPRYLVRRIPGIVRIPLTRTGELRIPELVVGDIDGNNIMDIRDYEIFRSCFEGNATGAACGSNRDLADLNDDGAVNLRDYRLLVEEGFQKQRGD